MADLLYDLLVTSSKSVDVDGPPALADADALEYLATLAAKPLAALQTDEPRALAQTAHSVQLSLQGLAKKGYGAVLQSAQRHTALQRAVPQLGANCGELQRAMPALDDEVVAFSKLRSHAEGKGREILQRRREALLLARNAERLVDVLELPPLLAAAAATAPVHHAATLDLHGHVRRLQALYPESPLVRSVAAEADASLRATAASLVRSLQAPNLKLAAALRTIGSLRRVLPDIGAVSGVLQTSPSLMHAAHATHPSQASPQTLGALFLVCRLATLTTMLNALEPLRDLADQERARQTTLGAGKAWSGGQQTERYLKRYLEIFREQSFAIVSMYRSIFSEDRPMTEEAETSSRDSEDLPPALATFPLHLVDLLLATLRQYLPTIRDQAARDSLLTQVLYCAGSLGRLGGDFGLFLATLDVGGGDATAEREWVGVVRRHRQLAGRLESMVGDSTEKR